jgi:hypothetical protein
LVWGTGVVAYLIAVSQRTSFGVAGLESTERYSASASALSIFTVVWRGWRFGAGDARSRFPPGGEPPRHLRTQ